MDCELLLLLLLLLGLAAVIVWLLSKVAVNSPTWKGIIISALLGLLPLYLILCFFGILGEEK